MFALVLIAIAVVFLYTVWKLRYRHPAAHSPRVLCYHKITNRFSLEGTRLAPERFAGQIDYLLERGYTFVDQAEFLAGLDAPAAYRAPQVLLTFDDGYSGSIERAAEILETRNIPALVFLVAGFAGRRNRWDLTFGGRNDIHLSWREARDLRRRGISFGSHGMTHADLSRLPPYRFRDELVQSKRLIEERLDCEVPIVSYPFGRYTDAVKAAAAAAGYRAAFSLYPSHPNDRVDRFALRRNGVYLIDTRGAVRRKLEPGPLYWLEEMKCRAINATSVVTPILKRPAANPDR